MIKYKQDLKFYLDADCVISERLNLSTRFLLSPDFLDPIGKFMYLLRMVEYYENQRINSKNIFSFILD
jgi:hypothetical protein